MAQKKQYTVRVSYKVYDYYTIEAKNEQEAIEQALEASSEDSLNDFTQQGDGEALVTQVNGKPVEPKKHGNEIEVLCIRYDDGEKRDGILAMKAEDWKNGSKANEIREKLKEIWNDEYLDDMADYREDELGVREEFEQCVTNLASGLPAEFCGDELFWETVPALL